MNKTDQYIETERLILRRWKEEDLPAFARLNSDERVMEYFPAPLSWDETVGYYHRIQQEFEAVGFGLYAVEHKQSHAFMGYIGLHNVTFEVDFAPAVEIGWRLLPDYWNQGYTTEGASACLAFAASVLPISEIYAFTSLLNQRSERVMQKIGMRRIKEFNHPLVHSTHRLCRHVLYAATLHPRPSAI